MKKRILAICDLEILYACNFMEYISQKHNIPFEVKAYTSTEKLMESAAKEHIEVLLISDKAMSQQVSQLSIGQIIILSEGVHDPLLDKYPSVYKYQSSDAVIREIMERYGENQRDFSPTPVLKKPMELLGIYSPLGRVLKTSFALTLGQILAKNQAVLYINLEEYSGFEQLFKTTYESGLSDLLYYIKQKQPNLSHRVSGMVQTINNLDYLPPVISPGDIRFTTYEEWKFFLEDLDRNSAYELVILDFGNGVDELLQLMDECSTIYMPVLSDIVSKCKIQQFENLLRLWDAIPLLEKIQKVKPPFHNSFGDGPQYAQQLVWSQLGDYVRQLLRDGSS